MRFVWIYSKINDKIKTILYKSDTILYSKLIIIEKGLKPSVKVQGIIIL